MHSVWTLLLVTTSAGAQPFPDTLWTNGGRYIWDGFSHLTSLATFENGDIVVALSSGEVKLFNETGNTIATRTLSDTLWFSPSGMVVHNDSLFLLANVRLPDSVHADFSIFKFDHNLTLDTIVTYSAERDNFASKIIATPDGYAVLGYDTWVVWSRDVTRPWVAELDQDLDLVNQTMAVFPPNEYREVSPTGFSRDSEGNYYVSAWNSNPYSFVLTKIGETGFRYWVRSYWNSYIPWGYTAWHHGHHILAGQSFGSSGIILEVDADGVEVQRLTTDLPHILNCDATSDGGLVVVGVVSGGGADGDYYIIKYDSMLTRSWSKRFIRPDYHDECWAIAETPDHGFILGGQSEYAHDYDAGPDVYLVKTGSDLGVVAGPTPTLRIAPIDGEIRLVWQPVSQSPMQYRIFASDSSEGGYTQIGVTSSTEYIVPTTLDKQFYRIYSIYDSNLR